ncbi:MAG: hypothetical protein MRERV_19c006 [Mycoplasmataceae bacterium RV_VA103A]|nr:MAG: hypothetical protein MRERV_19c006 [Mycoplasmataceae bacterium RV_VA103A]
MIGYEQFTKIVSCQIKGGELITQLDDERKIIIPVAALTKWQILEENVKPEQLKNYEIRNEGKIIYFPDIDEVLPSWIIIRGLHSACRD